MAQSNIGHNSVQIPHNGRYKPVLDEATWRKAERHQARRERIRLIRNGTIAPAERMKPQMMVKDQQGRWSPALSINGRNV